MEVYYGRVLRVGNKFKSELYTESWGELIEEKYFKTKKEAVAYLQSKGNVFILGRIRAIREGNSVII
ncbi:MAG: hypothetical protein ACPL5F_01010 [Moorellaceae bacterium]